MKSKFPILRIVLFLAMVLVLVASSWPWKSIPPRPKKKRTAVPSESPEVKAREERRTQTEGITSDYVGSHVCAECHSSIANKYRSSPMGRSLARVAETSAPHEDYEHRTSFEKGKCTYRIERRDDRVWHHEILSDQEGEIYDQAEEIQFAFGSNTRGRSYLTWRDGILYISPISWYANDGWDLSPGYTADQHFRFSRIAIDGCVICHGGRVTRISGRENYFPQPVFHELAIGCERCHGPGQDHVAYRRRGGTTDPDPLVNVSRLPASERDAICSQCHFSGEGRILRTGREETSFRPGMKLSDIWTVFVKGDGTEGDETAIVSQTMQMRSSRCFQSSEGRLGCVSCHDPHESPRADRKSSFYDERCAQCHADKKCSLPVSEQQAPPGNGSCIHCHMSPLKAKGVPHTSQTDHRVLRRSASATPSKPIDHTLQIFTEQGMKLPEEEKIRARGLMLNQLAETQQNREIAEVALAPLRQAARMIPNDIVVTKALGRTYEILGREQDAESWWKRALTQSPNDGEALLHSGSAAYKSGRFQEASRFYAMANTVSQLEVLDLDRWAHSLIQLQEFQQAIPVAEKAMKIDPSFLTTYTLLSQAHAALGEIEKSRHYDKLADRLATRLGQKK